MVLRNQQAQRLIVSTKPAILPGDCDALVIPDINDIVAIAVAELWALMPRRMDRSHRSGAGVLPMGIDVFYAIYGDSTPEPEIALGRDPESRPTPLSET
jgi:hypothetical protein